LKEYFKTLWAQPAACRKAIAAIVGVVLMLGAQGLLPDAPVVQYVLALLTAITTYAVRNDAVKVEDNG
jgi:hypothetical protein